jgi:hypothetical protein
VESEEIELNDVPDDVRFKAMQEGEEDYWSGRADWEKDLGKYGER